MSGPKKAPGAGEQTGRELISARAYHVLLLLQTPVGLVFWYIEQRKARLQDRIANKRDDNR
jgi:hypothetical protein